MSRTSYHESYNGSYNDSHASSNIRKRGLGSFKRSRITKLRQAGVLNRHSSVARGIFLCWIQTRDPFLRPDILESMSLSDLFDISEISGIEIRTVEINPSRYTLYL